MLLQGGLAGWPAVRGVERLAPEEGARMIVRGRGAMTSPPRPSLLLGAARRPNASGRAFRSPGACLAGGPCASSCTGSQGAPRRPTFPSRSGRPSDYRRRLESLSLGLWDGRYRPPLLALGREYEGERAATRIPTRSKAPSRSSNAASTGRSTPSARSTFTATRPSSSSATTRADSTMGSASRWRSSGRKGSA